MKRESKEKKRVIKMNEDNNKNLPAIIYPETRIDIEINRIRRLGEEDIDRIGLLYWIYSSMIRDAHSYKYDDKVEW